MTEPSTDSTVAESLVEVPPSPADWSVLDEPGVQDVLEVAVRTAANARAGYTTAEDLQQEAVIWLATNANQVREYLSSPTLGERALYRRLNSRLLNVVRDDPYKPTNFLPLPESPE